MVDLPNVTVVRLHLAPRVALATVRQDAVLRKMQNDM
jgi:hypothetical protein